jgi:hypothetical protein
MKESSNPAHTLSSRLKKAVTLLPGILEIMKGKLTESFLINPRIENYQKEFTEKLTNIKQRTCSISENICVHHLITPTEDISATVPSLFFYQKSIKHGSDK